MRRSCAPSSRWRTRSASDRKSTRLNSSHLVISYAVFCLKKKKKKHTHLDEQQQNAASRLEPLEKYHATSNDEHLEDAAHVRAHESILADVTVVEVQAHS